MTTRDIMTAPASEEGFRDFSRVLTGGGELDVLETKELDGANIVIGEGKDALIIGGRSATESYYSMHYKLGKWLDEIEGGDDDEDDDEVDGGVDDWAVKEPTDPAPTSLFPDEPTNLLSSLSADVPETPQCTGNIDGGATKFTCMGIGSKAQADDSTLQVIACETRPTDAKTDEISIITNTNGDNPIVTITPVEQPTASVEKPTASTEKPTTSTEKPSDVVATPVEKPSGVVATTEVAVEKPSDAVEKPSASIEKPSVSVEKPSDVATPPVEKPVESVATPEMAVEKPMDVVATPEVAVEKSTNISATPEVAVEKPTESVEKPTNVAMTSVEKPTESVEESSVVELPVIIGSSTADISVLKELSDTPADISSTKEVNDASANAPSSILAELSETSSGANTTSETSSGANTISETSSGANISSEITGETSEKPMTTSLLQELSDISPVITPTTEPFNITRELVLDAS